MKLKLVDVDNRLSIKYNKTDGIHNWGADNAYPQLIKSIISSSVTTKQCVDLNSKNISGKGFEFTKNVTDKNSLVINKKGLNINQLLRIASKEFSEINNLFFHVNYNALYEVISVDLLSSEDVRIGETDSTGYSGKFVVYNNWDKSKSKRTEKKDFIIIDKFNPNSNIINLQIEAAGGWNKYKGQILHVNTAVNEVYSLSDIDSVIEDADSENDIKLSKNAGLKKGFFGAKIFITKPFRDDYDRNNCYDSIQNLRTDKSGVFVLETAEETVNLADELLIQNVDSNIDFEGISSIELSLSKNIRKALGIPSILLEDNDNSVFGNSGELLKQAKIMLWENKEEERNIIIEAFQKLFSNFHKPINPNNNWNIIPIIEILTPNAELNIS